MTYEEEFIKSLYIQANDQLKEVYKEQKSIRDELLKEIAMFMITYNIVDGLMSMKRNNDVLVVLLINFVKK